MKDYRRYRRAQRPASQRPATDFERGVSDKRRGRRYGSGVDGFPASGSDYHRGWHSTDS